MRCSLQQDHVFGALGCQLGEENGPLGGIGDHPGALLFCEVLVGEKWIPGFEWAILRHRQANTRPKDGEQQYHNDREQQYPSQITPSLALLFAAVWMAFGARLKRLQVDIFFRMTLTNFIWLVFVATVASVFRVRSAVASLAGDLTLPAVVQREIVHLQACWRPGFCRMAVLALQAEEAGVDVRLSVAIHALRRCAAKDLLLVAILAGDFGMGAIQGENAGVIEIGHAVCAVVAVQAF